MHTKLKCVIIDDDSFAIEIIKDNCKDSNCVEIVDSFLSPKEFLKVIPELDFDLCILDIQMPDMDGFEVARELKNKLVVFVTGSEGRLKEAVDFGAVGVIAKPVTKSKLSNILEIAYKVIIGKQPLDSKEYMLFHIVGSSEKISIKLSDIVYVKTHHTGRLNKQVILKAGIKYILSNCNFDEFLESSQSLIQINQSELISLEAIHKIDRGLITLKIVAEDEKPKQVILNRSFKKDFFKRAAHI